MQDGCTWVSLVESIQDWLDFLVQILSLLNIFGKVQDHPPAYHGFLIVVLDVYVDYMNRVTV